MPRKEEYLEDLNTREFYDFYRRTRRKVSPKINQYNLFKKAINGFVLEIRNQLDQTEHGIHFKGFGVLYKKPFGDWFRRLSLFTHRRLQRGLAFFYLEDEYLRNKYIIINNIPRKNERAKGKHEEKADAVMLHRKLLNKK